MKWRRWNTPREGDAKENTCHLFNKLIFIEKKNVCGILEQMKSKWGFVNIQLYDPEVLMKFSWTRHSGIGCCLRADDAVNLFKMIWDLLYGLWLIHIYWCLVYVFILERINYRIIAKKSVFTAVFCWAVCCVFLRSVGISIRCMTRVC